VQVGVVLGDPLGAALVGEPLGVIREVLEGEGVALLDLDLLAVASFSSIILLIP